ncbi:MAG TPA: hypothetical protein VNO13_07935 [Candidatus Udaeobacter sp.]|nr:hypothetical protein [Candidatus Udaeobacter sp.]
MVSDRGAEWESEPLVACAEIVNCPAAAVGDAPIITGTGCPVVTEKGLAGLLVTPAGAPESVTCTLPVKPFKPATLTLTGALELPCAIANVVVERPIVKSRCGGGG